MHSSNSKFGSPSVFGQSQNPGNNQFSPTGGSIFRGTSTGVFGATSSSASSTAFGSPIPAFSASSTLGLGSSMFGQKPTFGASSTIGFGFNSSPSFGQPTMSAFSSSFLGTNQSPFGTQSSLSGGQASIPTLGSTGFGPSVSGEKLGSRVAPYHQTAVNGERLLSVPAMPVYNGKSHEELRWEDYHLGDKGGSRVGTTTINPKPFTPLTPSGHSFTNAFSSSTLTPSFTFRVSNTGFNSSPFSTSSSANSFLTNSAFGPNSSPSLSGQFISPSIPASSMNPFSSSMPSNPFTPQTPALSFPISPSTTIFNPPPTASLLANSFWTTPSSLPSTSSASSFGPNNSSVSLFGPSSSPAFSSSPYISQPNLFSFTSPAVTASSPLEIGTKNTPSSFASINSGFSSALSFAPSTQSSLLFTTSSFAPFSQSSPLFATLAPSTSASFYPSKTYPINSPSINSGFNSASSFAPFTQSSPQPSSLFTTLAPSTSASFLPTKPNPINSPSTGSTIASFLPSQMSTSTLAPPGQTNTSFSPTFLMAQTAQTSGTSFSPLFQPAQTAQTSGSSAFEGFTGGIGQTTAAQEFVSPSPPPVVNPFGTLPEMRQASYVCVGSTSSVHFGISSIPVSEKQEPSRVSSSLLTTQNLSKRRNRLPLQKYNPKSDPQKVPFFIDDDRVASFYPRENPKDLIVLPPEHWPKRVNSEKCSSLKPTHIQGQVAMEAYAPVLNVAIHEDEDGENCMGKACTTTHEATSLYDKHSADVTALMPKLHKCSEYYTEPQIQDLESKERAEPGSISRVKDFVIGRHGYGSIKFLGSTDVRQLELESMIQFNNREVIVYADETKKHALGQGLNKPAEVTLLNIKCFDKRTGKQYVNGPKVDKYREMLIKKATDQGAEFVSYDPVEGEWKFRVHHFN